MLRFFQARIRFDNKRDIKFSPESGHALLGCFTRGDVTTKNYAIFCITQVKLRKRFGVIKRNWAIFLQKDMHCGNRL